MKIGDKHYIIFTNDNEICLEKSLNKVFRSDIKFIIERTFVRKTNGQQLFNYCSNQILDANKNIVNDNTFLWGGIRCKLRSDEFYGNYEYFLSESMLKGVSVLLEVEDYLGKKDSLIFRTHHYNNVLKRYDFPSEIPFALLRDDLNMLNKIGTLEGLYESKILKHKIVKLEDKIQKLKAR